MRTEAEQLRDYLQAYRDLEAARRDRGQATWWAGVLDGLLLGTAAVLLLAWALLF